MLILLTNEIDRVERSLRMIQFDLEQAGSEAQRLRLIQSSDILASQLIRLKMKLAAV